MYGQRLANRLWAEIRIEPEYKFHILLDVVHGHNARIIVSIVLLLQIVHRLRSVRRRVP
ncbi:hypothetical protein D3C74_423400 [compost metagenome]